MRTCNGRAWQVFAASANSLYVVFFAVQEVVSMAGLMVAEDEEYSEAGRGLYPNGLFEVLTSFYQRYGKRQPNLRLIVTENGVGDSRDLLRRPFLIEHLLAVSEARRKVHTRSSIFHSFVLYIACAKCSWCWKLKTVKHFSLVSHRVCLLMATYSGRWLTTGSGLMATALSLVWSLWTVPTI